MAKFATILICKVNVSVIIRSLFIGCVWGGGGGSGCLLCTSQRVRDCKALVQSEQCSIGIFSASLATICKYRGPTVAPKQLQFDSK